MKKYLIPLILLVIFASCSKTQVNHTETDRKIIQDYIALHHLNAKSTASGLYYVIETPGSSVHPTIYSTVLINYTGHLANDTVFDKTQVGDPASLALASTIPGWQEGIPLFGRGGKGILLIPSSLGYSYTEQPKVPAYSVLIFEINLIDFN